MAQVCLKKVNKLFGQNHVVKDVSFDSEDGEFLVLVGPSGCGKSTTLRMIAGLETITSGEVYIGEQMVNELSPKDRDIAMVFQNYALYPHMTVYENMAFGLKLRGVSKPQIEESIDKASKILGIESFLARKPKALSGGQRQRVALGRAIVRNPKVFLFDEPLSNLDAKLRTEMREEIKRLHQTLKTTVVYVTHDQVEAMTLGERIIVMKDGVVQQIDCPLNLYRNPNNMFVASFVGSPSVNFIYGYLNRRGEDLLFRTLDDLQVRIPQNTAQKLLHYSEDEEIVLAIRPEDIYDKIFIDNPHDTNIIKVKANLIEPLGAEIHLHLSLGDGKALRGCSFIAAVNSNSAIQVGQEIELVLDMSRVHFFNPKTEECLSL